MARWGREISGRILTHSLSWGAGDWLGQAASNQQKLPEKRKENRVIFWLRVISIYPCGWSGHCRWRVHAVPCRIRHGGLHSSKSTDIYFLEIWLIYVTDPDQHQHRLGRRKSGTWRGNWCTKYRISRHCPFRLELFIELEKYENIETIPWYNIIVHVHRVKVRSN